MDGSIWEKWELIKGLAGPNVAGDMAPTSPVMNRNGATDETETKSAITTCAAGEKRDVVTVMKEIVEDRETVQSKESGKDVIVIDQKMVITLMAITQSRITDGNLERRRRARRSCSGVCLLMSLRKIFVLP